MEKSIHFLDDISQNCHSELPRRRLGDNDEFQLEVVPRMNGVSFTYLFIVFGLPAASAHTGRYWAYLGTVFENQIIKIWIVWEVTLVQTNLWPVEYFWSHFLTGLLWFAPK